MSIMSNHETREEKVVHYENNTTESAPTDSPAVEVNPTVVINNSGSSTKKEWLTMPMAVLLSGILIAGAIMWKSPAQAPVATAPVLGDVDTALLTIQKDDHVLGSRDANIVLMEWSDAECPFCQRHHNTVQSLMKKYEGKIAFVYRHYTLPFHKAAPKAAEALECAGEQGGDTAFFKYLDKIFEVPPTAETLSLSKLPVMAGAIGLNTEKFSECLASGRMAARVARDQKNGEEAGVTGTPHNVIWDKKSGANKALIGAQLESAFVSLLTRLGVK